MAQAQYRMLINGGESVINLELLEGDYSPLGEGDMPALAWSLGQVVLAMEGVSVVTVSRTESVTTDVPEV